MTRCWVYFIFIIRPTVSREEPGWLGCWSLRIRFLVFSLPQEAATDRKRERGGNMRLAFHLCTESFIFSAFKALSRVINLAHEISR